MEAVIQAIVPGTKLKSYLESRVDLTLQALGQILQILRCTTPSLVQFRNQEKHQSSFWCEPWS